MSKDKILSVTAKDFIWEFIRGSGNGGQKRNKTCSTVRCTHRDSGAMARCEDGRSQLHNRQEAFRKCVESKKFQDWLRIEISRKCRDIHEDIERSVDKQMDEKYLKIELGLEVRK